jgi:hypothetical protein
MKSEWDKFLCHCPIKQFSGKFEKKDLPGLISTTKASQILIRDFGISKIQVIWLYRTNRKSFWKSTRKSIRICPKCYLKCLRGKESIPVHLLNALLCKLQHVLKKTDSLVDYTYANGKRGRAIADVPSPYPKWKHKLPSWKCLETEMDWLNVTSRMALLLHW